MFLRRKRTSEQKDEDLVERLRDGHQASLGVLWDRYAHLLFGVGMKYLRNVEESRDTVMELFTDLPELLRKHRVERFRPWVHTVMRNRCLMRLRGRGREASALPADVADEDVKGEALLREASLERLERAITALKDEQRTCITLFHLKGLTYAEVATRTGFSLEEVRSHLQNGRRNLRLMLNDDADRN